MERYVYIDSTESNELFPENKVYAFKIHLNTPLVLDRHYRVALVEFCAKTGKTKLKHAEQSLYIYSDICTGSIVQGEDRPLLRQLVKNNRNSWEFILTTPFFIPLKRYTISDFWIYIKDSHGEFATFLEDPLKLTLLFAT